MRRKRPHVASLDEVRITREGDEAIIEYADERVWTTRLKLGPAVQHMTDEEIHDRWNEGVLTQEQFAAEYEYIFITVQGWMITRMPRCSCSPRRAGG